MITSRECCCRANFGVLESILITMLDHSAAMLAFLKLAGVSQTRKQIGPRDKFLVLGGVSALKAGWPDVAERCRELIVAHNPAHQLVQYPTFADALRSEDFEQLLKPLGKFCSYERAEHLLTQLRIAPGQPRLNGSLSDGEYALLLMSKADIPSQSSDPSRASSSSDEE